MAYMNQEKKAKIAAALKVVLKKYNVKGNLSVKNHSTISLTVKSGPIDFIQNFIQVARAKPHVNRLDDKQAAHMQTKQYLDVNPYWYEEQFNGTALKFLEEAFESMRSAGWYNNSDVQSDYFDVAYYVDLKIGKWDKPYVIA